MSEIAPGIHIEYNVDCEYCRWSNGSTRSAADARRMAAEHRRSEQHQQAVAARRDRA